MYAATAAFASKCGHGRRPCDSPPIESSDDHTKCSTPASRAASSHATPSPYSPSTLTLAKKLVLQNTPYAPASAACRVLVSLPDPSTNSTRPGASASSERASSLLRSRVTTRTRCPASARRCLTTGRPMAPVAPMTVMILSDMLHISGGRRP